MENLQRFNRITKRVKAIDQSQHSKLALQMVSGLKHNTLYSPVAMAEAARILEAILENFETKQGSKQP